jgi:hypothetical protein
MKILTILWVIAAFSTAAQATDRRLNITTTGDYKTAILWYTDAEGKHLSAPNQIVERDDDLHSQEGDIWHTWDNADCTDSVGSIDTYCHGICQRGWSHTTDPNGLPALATDERGFLTVTGWFDEAHDGAEHTIFYACGAEAMHQSIHYYNAPEDRGDLTQRVRVWYYRNDIYNQDYEPHWWEYIRTSRWDTVQNDPLPVGWTLNGSGELAVDFCGFFAAWLSEAEEDMPWDFNNDNVVNLKDWHRIACLDQE